MDLRPHSSKIVGVAVAVSALSLSFGGWALANHSDYNHNMRQSVNAPTVNPDIGNAQRHKANGHASGIPEGGTVYGDDIYKVENGVVYEYDDGWWEPKYDKKIENGIVYDFDDGRWKVEYDPNVHKGNPESNTVAPQPAPQQQKPTQVAPQPAPQAPAQNSTVPHSKYKVENGVVYEWDDGRWEPEYDKKSQNGAVYEYDDGHWERDYDDWDNDWDD